MRQISFIFYNSFNNNMEDDQECAFDDWQAAAEIIQQNLMTKAENQSKQTKEPDQITTTEAKVDPEEQNVDWNQYHLNIIQRYKQMTSQQFQNEFRNSDLSKSCSRQVRPINTVLNDQNDFNEMAKVIGLKFKKQAENQTNNLLPNNEILTFFQEFILYLYPVLEWKNLDLVKDKIKIVKKNKKQEEIKAKKIKEKQERNRRVHKQQETVAVLNPIGEVESAKICNAIGSSKQKIESNNIDEQI